jgi:hypothetical protein
MLASFETNSKKNVGDGYELKVISVEHLAINSLNKLFVWVFLPIFEPEFDAAWSIIL